MTEPVQPDVVAAAPKPALPGHKPGGGFAKGNQFASLRHKMAARAKRMADQKLDRTEVVFRGYMTPARLLEVVKRVYREAKAGKSWACLEILNRFYGKPDQPHSLAGTTVDIKVLFAQAVGPGKEAAREAVALAQRRTIMLPPSVQASLTPPTESPKP